MSDSGVCVVRGTFTANSADEFEYSCQPIDTGWYRLAIAFKAPKFVEVGINNLLPCISIVAPFRCYDPNSWTEVWDAFCKMQSCIRELH